MPVFKPIIKGAGGGGANITGLSDISVKYTETLVAGDLVYCKYTSGTLQAYKTTNSLTTMETLLSEDTTGLIEVIGFVVENGVVNNTKDIKGIWKIVPVTSVSVSPTTKFVEVGGTETITATVLPVNASYKTVIFSSSNTDVATVNSSTGVVTGVSAGSATITATSNNGKTATAAVTSAISVTGISLDITSKDLSKGYTFTLTPTVTPSNATTKTVSWSSSNTDIATVNSSGVVTGVDLGAVTITATTQDQSKTATCAVTVKSDVISVTGVAIIGTIPNIGVNGDSYQVVWEVYPENASNKAVTFSVSPSYYSTVNSSGLISGGDGQGSAWSPSYQNQTLTITTVDGNFTDSQTYRSEDDSCLLKGTEISLFNSKKNVEDITYQDDLLVWDFDKGEYATAKPIWITSGKADKYKHVILEDGYELETVNNHRILNIDKGKYMYPKDMIGDRTLTQDNKIVKVLSVTEYEKDVEYYNIITEYHLNLYANNLSTSCRLSNIYPIENMIYVKDERQLNDREIFKEFDNKVIDGLRLLEQPEDINRGGASERGDTIVEYVRRLNI